MNTAAQSWTLEELSREVERMLRAAGLLGAQADARVSAAPDARTVRYYTTLGLLDRPALDGRSARYGQKHLLQLVAIKALQAEGLPLSDIQSRLYGRGEGELKQLADLLVAKAREIEPPAPSLRTVTEIVLAPGMKLVVEDGWEVSEPGLLEQQFRAALAAIVKARIGPGGK